MVPTLPAALWPTSAEEQEVEFLQLLVVGKLHMPLCQLLKTQTSQKKQTLPQSDPLGRQWGTLICISPKLEAASTNCEDDALLQFSSCPSTFSTHWRQLSIHPERKYHSSWECAKDHLRKKIQPFCKVFFKSLDKIRTLTSFELMWTTHK